MPVADIPGLIRSLSLGKTSWKEVCEKYPKFEQQEASAASSAASK